MDALGVCSLSPAATRSMEAGRWKSSGRPGGSSGWFKRRAPSSACRYRRIGSTVCRADIKFNIVQLPKNARDAFQWRRGVSDAVGRVQVTRRPGENDPGLFECKVGTSAASSFRWARDKHVHFSRMAVASEMRAVENARATASPTFVSPAASRYLLSRNTLHRILLDSL